MERKVGEIFIYKGKTYKVLKATYGCKGCAFCYQPCADITKIECCLASYRVDGIGVIFKEVNNMENNQLTIDIPEGMNIDIVNSDLAKGIIKFRPKHIAYDNIVNSFNSLANINVYVHSCNINKFEAIARLMNIAKYYNKDWKPNWNNRVENKYFIIWNNECKTYWTDYNRNSGCSVVYFKNKEDAQSVIDNPNFREILDAIYKY